MDNFADANHRRHWNVHDHDWPRAEALRIAQVGEALGAAISQHAVIGRPWSQGQRMFARAGHEGAGFMVRR